ncbi:MAG: TetR/AcrR family transcriptional regulator [Solirubrobacteraceae bacterium]
MTELTAEARDSDPDALRPILKAARDAFAHFGVQRTRMEDIASRAGIPRQYLYRYVSSKEDLVALALLERCREFSDQILELTSAATGDPSKTLVDAIIASVIAGRQDTEFAALAETLPRARLSTLLTGSGSPMHTYVKRCLQPILDTARANGQLRADVTEDAMIDWLQGIMTWLTPRDDLDKTAMQVMLRDFALTAILTPPPR